MGSVYEEAHQKASPQSSVVYYRYLHELGIELPAPASTHPSAKYIEFYVRDNKDKIIRLYKRPVN